MYHHSPDSSYAIFYLHVFYLHIYFASIYDKFGIYWILVDDAADAVVTVVNVVDVVADDDRGVIACFSTTVAIELFFLLSSSCTSSPANHSSFSAFVFSEIFFPLKSNDSTFLCESMS